tara:strand:+ start:14588 stop:15382 length:795 start_codon:yes stop_codon:yes gene_type:complete
MQTQECLTAYIKSRTSEGLASETIDNYRYKIGKFAREYPELPEDPETIEEFLGSFKNHGNKDTYFRNLRTFYKFCCKRSFIKVNPMALIPAPRLPKKWSRSFTDEELKTVLTHSKQSEELRAFVWLIADTGMRLSEALSVTSESFKDGMVVIDGKVGERLTPVSPMVQSMVESVLPWPWHHRHTAGQAIRRAFKRAGVNGSRASAHSLRHTFVRNWNGDESVLVDCVGWTSPKMLKVYKPFSTQRAINQHKLNTPVMKALQVKF